MNCRLCMAFLMSPLALSMISCSAEGERDRPSEERMRVRACFIRVGATGLILRENTSGTETGGRKREREREREREGGRERTRKRDRGRGDYCFLTSLRLLQGYIIYH